MSYKEYRITEPIAGNIKKSRNRILRALDEALDDLSNEYYQNTGSRISYFNHSPIYTKTFDLPECNKELIVNALDSTIIKSAKDKKYIPLIEVLVRADDNLYLQIEDNGTGIDPKIESDIFKRRIDSQKPQIRMMIEQSISGGQGIGLKKLRNTIDKFNGTCGYINNHPEGAIFWYNVPLSGLVLKLESDYA